VVGFFEIERERKIKRKAILLLLLQVISGRKKEKEKGCSDILLGTSYIYAED
jgi:hypothetical protein